MNSQEKLRIFAETFAVEGALGRVPERSSAKAVTTLSSDVLRAKADYESNIRLVNAYFEHCLYKRADGASFERIKDEQTPESFADSYAHDTERIRRDRIMLDSEKERTELAAFLPRVAEALLWQAQRDYELLGNDIHVYPTSEFDDRMKGLDFVVEFPGNGGRLLGVDATKKSDDDPFLGSVFERKARMKRATGQHEAGYFRHGGIIRHLDYLHTPSIDGGVDVPATVLSIPEKDLFEYCRIVIDPETKKPRDTKAIKNDPRFKTFREEIFSRLIASLDDQAAALEKREELVRQLDERAVYERDGQMIADIRQALEEARVGGVQKAKIIELKARAPRGQEQEYMVEQVAAAIRSNHEILTNCATRLKEYTAPHLSTDIEWITGHEKDKERKTMIQELVQSTPLSPLNQETPTSLFGTIHTKEYKANAMVIAGMRSELIILAKKGDARATSLVKEIRTLNTLNDVIVGFERMFSDMEVRGAKQKSA